MTGLEKGLFSSGELMRRGYSFLSENASKVIAALTALIAALLTFWEPVLPSLLSEALTAELAVMLVASYVIYFSLEDAGERLGRQSDKYKTAKESYDGAASGIGADMLEELRLFTIDYSREELEYRRRSLLLCHGVSEEELSAYGRGEASDARIKRAAKEIGRLRALRLEPSMLLSGARTRGAPPLDHPTARKLISLLLGLLPSTLCMLFTVSMIITPRADMDTAAIISGIVKLSTLPMIGMRGYSSGYEYARGRECELMEAKRDILEAFLAKRETA